VASAGAGDDARGDAQRAAERAGDEDVRLDRRERGNQRPLGRVEREAPARLAPGCDRDEHGTGIAAQRELATRERETAGARRRDRDELPGDDELAGDARDADGAGRLTVAIAPQLGGRSAFGRRSTRGERRVDVETRCRDTA